MEAIRSIQTVNNGEIHLQLPKQFWGQEVEIIVLIPESAEDFTKEEIISDFRQAWHEAMTGQTIPLSQLWEGMEND